MAASPAIPTVLDAFCGIGGNAIGFARLGRRVIACDLDLGRLGLAAHNARLYRVAERIRLVHRDCAEVLADPGRWPAIDGIFMDPPWVGCPGVAAGLRMSVGTEGGGGEGGGGNGSLSWSLCSLSLFCSDCLVWPLLDFCWTAFCCNLLRLMVGVLPGPAVNPFWCGHSRAPFASHGFAAPTARCGCPIAILNRQQQHTRSFPFRHTLLGDAQLLAEL